MKNASSTKNFRTYLTLSVLVQKSEAGWQPKITSDSTKYLCAALFISCPANMDVSCMVVEDVFKSKLTHTPVGPDLWRKFK